MRVWLVTIGEPLPTDPGNERLLRAGIVAGMLAERGHEVVWWSSTFNHSTKAFRADRDVTLDVAPRYRLKLLHGGGYKRNVSLRRIVDHRRLAKRFEQLAPSEPRPDVILCSVPPLELPLAAVEYGRAAGIPVVLDIRDLWPDIFEDAVPRVLRPVVRLAARRMTATARQACVGAAAIWSHAPALMEWGLRHAARDATSLDRTFPFGYVSSVPSADEIGVALQTWRELGIDPVRGDFIASFVGAIGHQTDIESILAAAKLLDDTAIRFVVCGVGDRYRILEQQARAQQNVHFVGWRRRAEIWTLLRMSSVGIAAYVSRHDFLSMIPNKVPEYLSASLPIALNLGSGLMYDLVHESGCGFSYHGRAEELAEQLIQLRDDPPRLVKMRERAEQVFDARFRADRVYADLIAALRDVATDRGAAR